MSTDKKWVVTLTAIFVMSVILFCVPTILLMRQDYLEAKRTSYNIYYNDIVIHTPRIWKHSRSNCISMAGGQIICGDFRIEKVME